MDAAERGGATQSIKKVAAASFIGTTIEWYDFFLYGTAAALVFGELFFPESEPLVGTLLAFGTYAVGFAARPIGGVVFGHFGDRIGRKSMLVLSLLIMGVATFLIGVLPTFASIGIMAPILLVVLRFAQGIGVGGEWGGAVLMSVEHAPKGRRGFFGSWPQMGVPAGLLLSTGVFALVQAMTSEAAFMSWGWRVPFLASAILVGVGLFIRLKIMESPAFERVKETKTEAPKPIVDVVRKYPREVLTAMGMRVAENGCFYILTVFVLAYGEDELGLAKGTMLTGVIIAAAIGLVTVPLWGALSDRVGRKPLYLAGAVVTTLWAFPLFGLINTESPVLIWLSIVDRRQPRPRPHVRTAGRLLLRAVRHARALQRRLARLPARVGVRGRLRAADRDRAAGRQRRRPDARRALHGGHGPDLGGRDAVRAGDVPEGRARGRARRSASWCARSRFDRERFREPAETR